MGRAVALPGKKLGTAVWPVLTDVGYWEIDHGFAATNSDYYKLRVFW
jgi:hypothetical protein